MFWDKLVIGILIIGLLISIAILIYSSILVGIKKYESPIFNQVLYILMGFSIVSIISYPIMIREYVNKNKNIE